LPERKFVLDERLSLHTPRGEIEVTDPASFQRRYGHAAPDVSRGARLAAMRFAVKNLDTANAALSGSNPDVRQYQGKLIVSPQSARGVTLVFETLRAD